MSACQMSNITNRTFLYILRNDAGFGSELNQVLLALAYSVSTKRQFLVDSRQWNYGNFSDYFNIISSTNYSQLNSTLLTENNLQNERINHLHVSRLGTQLLKLWSATLHVQSMEIKRRVAHYLWKSMSHETLTFVRTCKLRNLSNYIGIHIRKGDKVRKEAREISLDKYITAIMQLFEKNQTIVHNIFVASDDHTVIKQLRQMKPTWNFVSSHDYHPQRIKAVGHFQRVFNRLSQKQKLYETRLLMCELQMLMNSEYLVCGMSSNVCRLVQVLRYQHPSTAISLDESWYPT